MMAINNIKSDWCQIIIHIFMLSLMLMPLSALSNDELEELEYSEAQILLFDSPHLANIKEPSRLVYTFIHHGKSHIDDSVVIDVKNIDNNNKKDVEFEFLTGERRVTYPGVKGFSGNPLVMLFMEWNVGMLQSEEKTGVNEIYLRNQMKIGFWKYCEVDDIEVQYQGKNLVATRVKMQPFLNNARLAYIKNKYYEFFLSDAIPGGIYKINASDSVDKNKFTEIKFLDME